MSVLSHSALARDRHGGAVQSDRTTSPLDQQPDDASLLAITALGGAKLLKCGSQPSQFPECPLNRQFSDE
jgi:hypothetical protein